MTSKRMNLYDITEVIIVNLVNCLVLFSINMLHLTLENVTFEIIIQAFVALSVIVFNTARAIHWYKKKDNDRENEDN